MSETKSTASPEDILVGGQAVIEGVMMRTPRAYAIAVRHADGSIEVKRELVRRVSEYWKPFSWLVIRGFAVLIQSMFLGIRALNFSINASMADLEPEKKGKPKGGKEGSVLRVALSMVFGVAVAVLLFFLSPPWIPSWLRGYIPAIGVVVLINSLFFGIRALNLSINASKADLEPEKKRKSKGSKEGSVLPVAMSMVFGVAVAVLLFILLPLWITSWLRGYIPAIHNWVVFNLVDGLIRVIFFLTYLLLVSLMKDIRRVFQYHGAEHKVVHTWEAGEELSIENARRKTTLHPRCGTSFLMFVMVVSIIVFSIFKFSAFLAIFLSRLVLIPVVSGLSYELIRFSAPRCQRGFFRLMVLPGLTLQRITTKEPSDDQLETAIRALKEALELDGIKAREAQTAA